MQILDMEIVYLSGQIKYFDRQNLISDIDNYFPLNIAFYITHLYFSENYFVFRDLP